MSSSKTRFSWLRMPCFVCSSACTMKARFLSGFGTTSTAPGVGGGEGEVLLDDPARHLEADAGLARVEAVVVLHPKRPPAGVEEHGVARLDVARLHVLALERSADVGNHDLLAGIHHPALHGLDVDEMPAGEKRLQLLDSELLQAIGVADFRSRVAVLEAHLGLVAVLAELDADLAEAVELRPDLTDLGGQEL